MKKILIIGALCLSLTSLTACSNNNAKTHTESKQEKKETKITVDSIITEFKNADLQAENPTDLPQKEFGNLRKEGKRIVVPALGEDKGGRLFEITKKEDLEKVKKYYDKLRNSAPMLFSHTHANGNFLLQMNGDMKDEEFTKYKDVMDKFIK
ncbi:stress protein [Bacillus albus]|nr:MULTISPECIES: stress protein [Bacillus cereus group]MDA2025522.1 stress protein [Bacillus cereus group sp. Bcc03]MDA2216282.1 stress protein [Bacillus cereus group sp. Bc228]MDA2230214.1 stress protein [Bacillus cereus group sp. Bc227]MDA2260279.1 stress protein [Bacillus cereus group sp. Bc200]MDA2324380.1 stress protein [Bacillus cereus group sp. Bc177]